MSIVSSHGGPKTPNGNVDGPRSALVGARQQKPNAGGDRTEAPDDEPLGPERVQHRLALEGERVAVAVVVGVLADLDGRALHERAQEHHALLSGESGAAPSDRAPATACGQRKAMTRSTRGADGAQATRFRSAG
jgi:hypothetical protein